MIHIAIVEDEEIYTRQLKNYINRYCKENGQEITMTFFTDGDEIALHYTGDYDIILMDIQMKFMNGMVAAKKIREMDGNVVIMFITNMTQYAIQGYQVDALDYVVKPVEYFTFSQKLDKAIERTAKTKNDEYLSVTTNDGIKKLNIAEIFYVESSGHYLSFETKRGVFKTRATMKNVETVLEPYGFCRCHKGFLVNMKYVDEVRENNCILRTGQVPVSRVYRKNFMEKLTSYIGKGI